MTTKKPTDLKSLFDFYYLSVKPLYSEIQTQNKQAVEMLFEINAALDHLSRIWHYSEDERLHVEKAYSHFKRACLDAFKIKLKEIRDDYDDLRKLDLSLIEDGEFEKQMILLFNEIRLEAKAARHSEGDGRNEDERVRAFDLWIPVYDKCIRFHTDYFLNPTVARIRKKSLRQHWWDRLEGLAIGVASSTIAAIILQKSDAIAAQGAILRTATTLLSGIGLGALAVLIWWLVRRFFGSKTTRD